MTEPLHDPASETALYELIARYLDNQLEPEEVSLLEARLLADKGGCDALRDVCMHMCLIAESPSECILSLGKDDSLPQFPGFAPLPDADVLSSPVRRAVVPFFEGVPMAYLMASLITAVALWVGSLVYVSHPGQIVQSDVAAASPARKAPVGRITGTSNCRWIGDSPSSRRVALGQRFELASGLMEITYDTGAQVVLQGRVTYEVDAADGGSLSLGKLTVRVERPAASGGQQESVAESGHVLEGDSPVLVGRKLEQSPAHSSPTPNPLFVVRTPTATVTDLGTEFGVAVSPAGGVSAYVFRGVVRVEPSEDGRRGEGIVLTENRSLRVEKATPGKKLEVRQDVVEAGTFVRAGHFTRLAEENGRTAFRRWQAYAERLRGDPSLVAYYTFDQQENDLAVLPNRSAAGNALDGKVEGAGWVDGRLPGKRGLQFHGPGSGDRVVLPDPDRFEFPGAFSIAAWFMPQECASKESYLDIAAKGGSSWLLQRNEYHTLRFDTCSNTVPRDDMAGYWQFIDGTTQVNFGQWYCLVVVFEPTDNVAYKRLYVDGRLEGSGRTAFPRRQNQKAAWIGANCDFIGGREFCGVIDEVAFFNRVLTPAEIRAMYRCGRPAPE